MALASNYWVMEQATLILYMVMTPDEKEQLGCLYIYESGKAGYDVDVAFWTRDDREADLDDRVSAFVKNWLEEFWPFKRVAYPGRDIPWSEWETMPDKNPMQWRGGLDSQSIPLHKMLPDDFDVPVYRETERFRLQPYGFDTFGMEYEAHISSVDAIRQQLPNLSSRWPSKTFSMEQQARRVGYEARNFAFRHAFAYCVTQPVDIPLALGAVYIVPTHKLGFEAEVFIWVRDSEMGSGLREELYHYCQQWIASDWPFSEGKVLLPGHNISWDDWQALPETEAIQWK